MHRIEFLYWELIANPESQMLVTHIVPHFDTSNVIRDSLPETQDEGACLQTEMHDNGVIVMARVERILIMASWTLRRMMMVS